MSLYDNESPKFLTECLESLSNQTRPPNEVVIVFDGPINNNLVAVVDAFYVRLPVVKVQLAKNSGLAIALNEGLKHCSGNLIARMDTDDISAPIRLEKQECYIINNMLDVVGTAALVIDFDGKVTGARVNPESHAEIMDKLWCNPFIHPSVMFVKSSIVNIGAYDSSLRRRQDYELWFRAAKYGLRFGNLQEELIQYRFDLHTLKKQSPKLAWQQGQIGFLGSMSCNLGLVRAISCFIPFIRSLFPIMAQAKFTQFMGLFDSRVK